MFASIFVLFVLFRVSWQFNCFAFKKRLSIATATTTVLDTQLTINTKRLIALGHVDSTCSNLRFKEVVGGSELEYYVEGGCNTVKTRIWVKPTGGCTSVDMYYDCRLDGNPDLPSGSLPGTPWSTFGGEFYTPFATGTVCPDGFTAVTDGNNRFIQGHDLGIGATDNVADSHSHSSLDGSWSQAPESTGAEVKCSMNNAILTTPAHTHAGTTTASLVATSGTEGLPPYVDSVLCSKSTLDYAQHQIFPTWRLSSSETLAGIENLPSSYNERFMHTGPTAGATGGASTHTHDLTPGYTFADSEPTLNCNLRDKEWAFELSHTHALSAYGSGEVSVGSNFPGKYMEIVFGRVSIPDDVVPSTLMRFLTDADPPMGFEVETLPGLDYLRYATTSDHTEKTTTTHEHEVRVELEAATAELVAETCGGCGSPGTVASPDHNHTANATHHFLLKGSSSSDFNRISLRIVKYIVGYRNMTAPEPDVGEGADVSCFAEKQWFAITVDPAGNDVLLIVDTKALIDAGKLSSDCSNLRFRERHTPESTVCDITQFLPYTVESSCGTTNTRIWITPVSSTCQKYEMFYDCRELDNAEISVNPPTAGAMEPLPGKFITPYYGSACPSSTSGWTAYDEMTGHLLRAVNVDGPTVGVTVAGNADCTHDHDLDLLASKTYVDVPTDNLWLMDHSKCEERGTRPYAAGPAGHDQHLFDHTLDYLVSYDPPASPALLPKYASFQFCKSSYLDIVENMVVATNAGYTAFAVDEIKSLHVTSQRERYLLAGSFGSEGGDTHSHALQSARQWLHYLDTRSDGFTALVVDESFCVECKATSVPRFNDIGKSYGRHRHEILVPGGISSDFVPPDRSRKTPFGKVLSNLPTVPDVGQNLRFFSTGVPARGLEVDVDALWNGVYPRVGMFSTSSQAALIPTHTHAFTVGVGVAAADDPVELYTGYGCELPDSANPKDNQGHPAPEDHTHPDKTYSITTKSLGCPNFRPAHVDLLVLKYKANTKTAGAASAPVILRGHVCEGDPDCSGHGSCIGYNKCNCDNAYGGDKCEFDGCYGLAHNADNVCGGHGTCNKDDNTCTCTPGSGYSGQECDSVTCVNNCSGTDHGTCVDYNVCACKGHYTGTYCEKTACTILCSAHGTCLSSGVCQCVGGYGGDECEAPECNGQTGPAACSNNGECVHNSTTNSSSCVCYNPSTHGGDKCEQLCYGKAGTEACHGHGTCDSSGGAPGVCTCTGSYDVGDNCASTTCDSSKSTLEASCDSHGSCTALDTCECHTGWTGDIDNCATTNDCCDSATCSDDCSPGICTGPNTCACRDSSNLYKPPTAMPYAGASKCEPAFEWEFVEVAPTYPTDGHEFHDQIDFATGRGRPGSRSHGTMVSLGTKLYLFGGAIPRDTQSQLLLKVLTGMWTYDTATANDYWMLEPHRADPDLPDLGDHCEASRGEYKLANCRGQWGSAPEDRDKFPGSRFGHTMLTHKDWNPSVIYLFGGTGFAREENPGDPAGNSTWEPADLNDLHIYDTGTDAWKEMGTDNQVYKYAWHFSKGVETSAGSLTTANVDGGCEVLPLGSGVGVSGTPSAAWAGCWPKQAGWSLSWAFSGKLIEAGDDTGYPSVIMLAGGTRYQYGQTSWNDAYGEHRQGYPTSSIDASCTGGNYCCYQNSNWWLWRIENRALAYGNPDKMKWYNIGKMLRSSGDTGVNLLCPPHETADGWFDAIFSASTWTSDSQANKKLKLWFFGGWSRRGHDWDGLNPDPLDESDGNRVLYYIDTYDSDDSAFLHYIFKPTGGDAHAVTSVTGKFYSDFINRASGSVIDGSAKNASYSGDTKAEVYANPRFFAATTGAFINSQNRMFIHGGYYQTQYLDRETDPKTCGIGGDEWCCEKNRMYGDLWDVYLDRYNSDWHFLNSRNTQMNPMTLAPTLPEYGSKPQFGSRAAHTMTYVDLGGEKYLYAFGGLTPQDTTTANCADTELANYRGDLWRTRLSCYGEYYFTACGGADAGHCTPSKGTCTCHESFVFNSGPNQCQCTGGVACGSSTFGMCNTVTGVCTCTNEHYWVKDVGCVAWCGSGCGAHGTCSGIDKCDCTGGYWGEHCENEAVSASGICYNRYGDAACGGPLQGTCPGGPCTCLAGYSSGPDSCQYYYCAFREHAEEGVCDGHGKCISPGTCQCEYGYSASTGDNTRCDVFSCWGVDSQNTDRCSGHGGCSTRDTCSCDYGYSGFNCSTYYCFGKLSTNLDVCYQHGKCTGADTCQCDTGYGPEGKCDTYMCGGKFLWDDGICSGHGSCSAVETCHCTYGYDGKNCDSPQEYIENANYMWEILVADDDTRKDNFASKFTGDPIYPAARSNSAMCAGQRGGRRKFYLFGGYRYESFSDEWIFGDLWELDDFWVEWYYFDKGVSENATKHHGVETGSLAHPGARYDHSLTSVSPTSEKLYMFGGMGYSCDPTSSRGLLNDLWMLDMKVPGGFADWKLLYAPSGGIPASHWVDKLETDSYPGCRQRHLSWALTSSGNDQVYIWGGIGCSKTNYVWNVTKTLWNFDTSKSLWTPEATTTPANLEVRELASSWVWENNLYFFGGAVYGGAIRNDIWRYRLSDKTWINQRQFGNGTEQNGKSSYSVSGKYPSGRAVSGSGIHPLGDYVFIFGGVGYDAAQQTDTDNLADVWSYHLAATEHWQPWEFSSTLRNNRATHYVASNYSTGGWPGQRSFASYAFSEDSYGEWVLYVFGGDAGTIGGSPSYKGDLWRLQLTCTGKFATSSAACSENGKCQPYAKTSCECDLGYHVVAGANTCVGDVVAEPGTPATIGAKGDDPPNTIAIAVGTSLGVLGAVFIVLSAVTATACYFCCRRKQKAAGAHKRLDEPITPIEEESVEADQAEESSGEYEYVEEIEEVGVEVEEGESDDRV